jgi:hypothetical protein
MEANLQQIGRTGDMPQGTGISTRLFGRYAIVAVCGGRFKLLKTAKNRDCGLGAPAWRDCRQETSPLPRRTS